MPSAFVPYQYQRYHDDDDDGDENNNDNSIDDATCYYDTYSTFAPASSNELEEEEDMSLDAYLCANYDSNNNNSNAGFVVVSPPQVQRKTRSILLMSKGAGVGAGSSARQSYSGHRKQLSSASSSSSSLNALSYLPLEEDAHELLTSSKRSKSVARNCNSNNMKTKKAETEANVGSARVENVISERNGLRDENDKLRQRLYEAESTIRKLSLILKNQGCSCGGLTKSDLELVRTASSTDTEDCQQNFRRRERISSFESRRNSSVESLDMHHRISPNSLVDVMAEKCSLVTTATNSEVVLNESIPQFRPSLLHELPYFPLEMPQKEESTQNRNRSSLDYNEGNLSDDDDNYFEQPLHGTDFLSDEPLRGADFVGFDLASTSNCNDDSSGETSKSVEDDFLQEPKYPTAFSRIRDNRRKMV